MLNNYQLASGPALPTGSSSVSSTPSLARRSASSGSPSKDTGDTRESPAIYISQILLDEGAHVAIYDPKVGERQVRQDLSDKAGEERVTCHTDPMVAAEGSYAVVVCTDWDEFQSLDYEKIYNSMKKPAVLLDGRRILDHERLVDIGFHVETVGKQVPVEECIEGKLIDSSSILLFV